MVELSSVVAAIGSTKTTLTTGWQRITVTATVPSISDKTLGSDGNDSFRLNIWFDAGSDYNSRTDTLGQQSGTFDIAQVQVEPGPVATPFERRPIGTELALCQRYFQKSDSAASRSHWQGYVVNGAQYLSHAPLQVSMRIAPTVTLTNTANSGFSTATGGITVDTLAFKETRTCTGTENSGYFISTWAASAEL